MARRILLYRGIARGEDVVAWQRIIGAKPDGVFGSETERLTRAWRLAHHLPDSGSVDDACWILADSEMKATTDPVPPTSPTGTAPLKFVQAKYYRAGRFHPVTGAACDIDVVYAHSMEAVEKPNTAEGVASWFARGCPDDHGVERKASAHLCGDVDSTVECVRAQNMACGASGANHNGYHVEFAGYASQGAAGWADAYSEGMLRTAAPHVARVVLAKSIPLVALDAEALLRGERGFSTHHQATLAIRIAKKRGLTSSSFYNAKGDHVDPGPGWPMEHWINLVRAAIATS